MSTIGFTLLFLIALGGLSFLVLEPPITQAQTLAQVSTKIPVPLKGRLIIYRVGVSECHMFVSGEGMAKGTVPIHCVLLPGTLRIEGGYPFEILHVIETTDD
jgi:hypothetical protein